MMTLLEVKTEAERIEALTRKLVDESRHLDWGTTLRFCAFMARVWRVPRLRVAARFQIDRETLARWLRDRRQDVEAAPATVPDDPLPAAPRLLDPCEIARRVLLAMAAGKVPATGPRVAACRAVIETAVNVPARPPDTVTDAVADSWDSLLQ